METFDLIGVGFGPSNISLAIDLEEQSSTRNIKSVFLEKQKQYRWHSDMILDHAHMQVSFLKDLVTLRNPSSKYTFINYIHTKNRLSDFINLKSFFPSRFEFDDYIQWAAAQLSDYCNYGEEVIEVLPEITNGIVSRLKIKSQELSGNIKERLATNLVIAVGGVPYVPDSFTNVFNNVEVFHSHHYLSKISQHPNARRLAVIGAGQSAVEVFLDLHARFPEAHIDMVSRRHTIAPPDDSPFVNEIYNPETTDYLFNLQEQERANILEKYWDTNYSSPDLNLLTQLYALMYEQKVAQSQRRRILLSHTIKEVNKHGEHISIAFTDNNTKKDLSEKYDIVVLATGYKRRAYENMLKPLAPYIDDIGKTDRNYKIISNANFEPRIFLQGECQSTHGLSDYLLSVMPIRVNEILQNLKT